jgi:uncharacterized membrane protein
MGRTIQFSADILPVPEGKGRVALDPPRRPGHPRGMTLAPLLDAPAVVQIHVAAALLSVAIGPVAIFRRSRDIVHRVAGRIWVVTMAVTAGSSFLIHEDPMFGPFSIIHVLSVITLLGLAAALRAIRAGDVARHGATMRALYAQALLLAGAFTFYPGRRMSEAFFPDRPWIGLAAMLALALSAVWILWREGRRYPLPFAGGLR